MMLNWLMYIMRLWKKMVSNIWDKLIELNNDIDKTNLEIFSYKWGLKCMDMDDKLLEIIITGAYKEWKRRNKNE